ncbi:AAA family ATPase [Candidatus Peregrinibacteria bacterium]|jgi:DNA polymerase III subunit gamma/tau|nr:AAA family ATPase [Candidatus Peregrinibacteria bacterium]
MLHTKHRPQDFKEVIGNKHIVESLESLFDDGKSVAHTFLFHGPSGCGKTTFARIIASKLNCSEFDFVEINAGNNRGIGTAREVLKTVEYKPMQGDTKVILLDEVHQTTKDFQNALLKILEDTPRHAYFILCTTDPRKLLTTIRNRCVTYEVEPLGRKNLTKLLNQIVKKEGGKLKDEVADKLVKKAEGCPRQLLVLLQQVINMSEKNQLKAIKTFKTQEQKVIDLCRAILVKKKWGEIAKILRGIDEDPEYVRRAILGYMNSVMLKSEDPHCMIAYLAFKDPFYDTGKAGLTFSCYKAISY